MFSKVIKSLTHESILVDRVNLKNAKQKAVLLYKTLVDAKYSQSKPEL